MEIKINAKHIRSLLLFITWLLFIGISIEAGGFIFNTIFSLVFNNEKNTIFWKEIDLSQLLIYDKGYFLTQTLLMIIVALMRAILFYFILKLLLNKNFDFAKPFSYDLKKFISNSAILTLGLGIFSYWGNNYSKWLVSKGIGMPSLELLRLGGADVWLFMSVTLFVIAYFVKKGIEIQNENELTI